MVFFSIGDGSSFWSEWLDFVRLTKSTFWVDVWVGDMVDIVFMIGKLIGKGPSCCAHARIHVRVSNGFGFGKIKIARVKVERFGMLNSK